MGKVQLREMSLHDIESIWSSDSTDPYWPVQPAYDLYSGRGSSLEAFQAYVEAWQAAEAVGWGRIRTVVYETPVNASTGPAPGSNECVLGFVTFQLLDDESIGAVESGTYLRASYRRQGWNATIKRLAITYAVRHLGANDIVYAVPEENLPAHSSLTKILGVWADPVNPANHFSAWMKYREWKEGKPMRFFVINLETAKACHLLDPDGEDRHFVGKQ